MRNLLQQVYWPSDKAEQGSNKLIRLMEAMQQVCGDRTHAWDVIIRRHAKPRSIPANNYLWGVVYAMMSEESGYEKEELHELLCGKHFGTKVVTVLGLPKRVPIRSTTTDENGEEDVLPPKEFAEFVDFAIREAAQHMGLAIPPPSLDEVPRG